MAITARRTKVPGLLPTTTVGVAACTLFAISLLLFAARLFLKPALDIPLNFLVVFIAMAASGLVALYAVALRHERSLATFTALVAGLLAATLLVAETLAPGPPSGLGLGEAANGKTFTLQKGAQITLQLPGNPTTGYSWEASVSNPAVLKQSSAPVYKPTGAALGSGGTYTFWYETVGSGSSDLTLVYRRSWETDVAPLKTFRVTVSVP